MGVLLAVLLLVLFSLLLAPRVMSVFGETDANVLSRILGVLLAALAVQFVLEASRKASRSRASRQWDRTIFLKLIQGDQRSAYS